MPNVTGPSPDPINHNPDPINNIESFKDKTIENPSDTKTKDFSKNKFADLKSQVSYKIRNFISQQKNSTQGKLIRKSSESISSFFQKASTNSLYKGYSENVKESKFIEKNITAEDKIKKINDDIELENTKHKPNEKIIKQLENKFEKETSKLQRRNTFERLLKKGDEVRDQMVILGAERISIETPDKVKLDGMYLDAKKFRETLKNAGAVRVSYELNVGGEPRKLEGISLSKDNWELSGKQVMNSLKLLHGIADDPYRMNPHPGAGWTAVQDGENIMLVRSEDVPVYNSNEAKSNPFFVRDKDNKMWTTKDLSRASVKKEEIDTSKKSSGVVIMSSGNSGIYEMHKDEALFYLFKNMDVVLFNYRGYGKSEGTPSEMGLKIDMESAYQLAKEKSGHPDNKILFKALCMSGGLAAYVASKHPETNIFLDQTYSSMRQLVKDEIKSKVKGFIIYKISETDPGKERVAEFIASLVAGAADPFIKLFFPDYKTSKYLSRIKGKKAILYTDNDQLINTKHVEKNIKAIKKVSEMGNTKIFSMPGNHSTSILRAESSPYDRLDEDSRIKLEYFKKTQSYANEINKSIWKNDNKIPPMFFTMEGQLLPNINEDFKEAFIDLFEKETEFFKNVIEIREEINALLLPLGLTESDSDALMRQEKIGLNQMDSFLKNANLSSDIIKGN